MKKQNLYENNLDRTWYESSNIVYSECIDNEGELKTVKVVFNGGRTYEYIGVKVNDYLMFRESPSQGKALNQFLKQYEAKRLDDSNIEEINSKYEELISEQTPPYVTENNGVFEIHKGTIIIGSYDFNEETSNHTQMVKEMLEKLNLLKN